jgi:hypothetical protein
VRRYMSQCRCRRLPLARASDVGGEGLSPDPRPLVSHRCIVYVTSGVAGRVLYGDPRASHCRGEGPAGMPCHAMLCYRRSCAMCRIAAPRRRYRLSATRTTESLPPRRVSSRARRPPPPRRAAVSSQRISLRRRGTRPEPRHRRAPCPPRPVLSSPPHFVWAGRRPLACRRMRRGSSAWRRCLQRESNSHFPDRARPAEGGCLKIVKALHLAAGAGARAGDLRPRHELRPVT